MQLAATVVAGEDGGYDSVRSMVTESSVSTACVDVS